MTVCSIITSSSNDTVCLHRVALQFTKPLTCSSHQKIFHGCLTNFLSVSNIFSTMSSGPSDIQNKSGRNDLIYWYFHHHHLVPSPLKSCLQWPNLFCFSFSQSTWPVLMQSNSLCCPPFYSYTCNTFTLSSYFLHRQNS